MVLFNRETVNFEGNWLFTGPSEIPHPDSRILRNMIQQRADDTDSEIDHIIRAGSVQRNYGATPNSETLGTLHDQQPPGANTGITSNYTAPTTGSSYATRTGTADRFYEAIEEEDEDSINEQEHV